MIREVGLGAGVGHNAWVTTGLSLEMWKVGCTRLMVGGSLSQTAVGLMILVMLNGPMNRGANFLVPPRIGMSLVESHMCCPTQYVGSGVLFLSASCFIRAVALMRLARVTLQVLFQRLTKACAEGTPTSSSWLGNNGGWYPEQLSNGDILEAADVWLFIVYSAHSNCALQVTGLLAHRHLRTVSMA